MWGAGASNNDGDFPPYAYSRPTLFGKWANRNYDKILNGWLNHAFCHQRPRNDSPLFL